MTSVLIATGPSACFVRPEFDGDLISYDVISPMAARGLFEAVHWTPAIRWQIERIEVLHPIRTEWLHGARDAPSRQLRLLDVAYALHARFELTASAGPGDNAGQHLAIFKRRALGQRFHQPPYFGRRDCAADVRLAAPGQAPRSEMVGSGSIDLGWMVFDRALADGRRSFFRPMMIDGVIDLTGVDPATLPC